MSIEEIYNGLTDEQKARAKECKTPEDILQLAKESGYELSEGEMEAIAGGKINIEWKPCPWYSHSS